MKRYPAPRTFQPLEIAMALVMTAAMWCIAGAIASKCHVHFFNFLENGQAPAETPNH